MKVSIITVCYNSESTIEDTIQSVLSQNYPDIEYIVVDGSSKDNTVEIINKYAERIEKVVSEPDNGIYDAMNKGISIATGELIGILNSDDLFVSNTTISEVVSHINGDTSKAVYYGDIAIVERNDIGIIKRRYAVDKFSKLKLRMGVMPPHPATFVFKSIYNEIGSYRINYKIAADYEFYVRATMKHGIAVKKIDMHIVNMRDGGVSTSGFNFFKISSGEMTKALRENGFWSHPVITSIRLPLKYWSKISGRTL